MACPPQISAGHLQFWFRSRSGLSPIIGKCGPFLLLTQSQSGGLGHHLHPPLNGVLQKLFKKKKLAALCSMWEIVPRPGIGPANPAVKAWILNHWTTREVHCRSCWTLPLSNRASKAACSLGDFSIINKSNKINNSYHCRIFIMY